MSQPIDSSASLSYENAQAATAVAPAWSEFLFFDVVQRKYFGSTHLSLENTAGVVITYSFDGGATVGTLAAFQTMVNDFSTVRGVWLQSAAGGHIVKVRARMNCGRSNL